MSMKTTLCRLAALVLAAAGLVGYLCQPANARTHDPEDCYQKALSNAAQGKYFAAVSWMEQEMQAEPELGSECYREKKKLLREFGLFQTSYISAGENKSVRIHEDGTLTVTGSNSYYERVANQWTDITAVSVGKHHIVGLKTDGTVVAAGSNNSGRCNVADWKNMIAVAAGGHHTVGLTSEGKLLAVGTNSQGQCQVDRIEEAADWDALVAIAAGKSHTLALTEVGTVLACGDDSRGACQVQDWTDIVSICAGDDYSAGLKADGTVVVAGKPAEDWNLSGWTSMVQLAAGGSFLVGLKENGRVIFAGAQGDYFRKCLEPVAQWEDVRVIAAGDNHIVALTREGTALSAGYNNYRQCDFPDVQAREPAGIRQIYTFLRVDGEQYGVIQKWGKDGGLCWEYITQKPDYASQYGPIWVIGQAENRFWFTENLYAEKPGALVCLDTDTGAVLWRNTDFSSGANVYLADGDGTLYLSAFEGAAFFAVSGEGKTICRINSFEPYATGIKWMRKKGDSVYLAFDEGLSEGKVYLYRVFPRKGIYQYEGVWQESELDFC